MYGVAELVIVPAVLGGALVLGILLIAARAGWAHIRLVNAQRAEVERHTQEHITRDRDLWRDKCRLGDAVDAVITEIAAHPATYETFPQDVLAQLMDAHDIAKGSQPEGNNRLT